MTKYIIKHNLTESYSQEYNDVCYYFSCQEILTIFLNVIITFSENIYRLLYAISVTILYDLYLEESSPDIVLHQPVDIYPQ